MQLAINQLVAFLYYLFLLIQTFLFMARCKSCRTFAASSFLLTIQLIKTKLKCVQKN